jgi:hypothetical protein
MAVTSFDFSAIVGQRTTNYIRDSAEWREWRLCYEGGRHFRDVYLEYFPQRETAAEYEQRKRLTPIPTAAKTAINRIRNSLFQRFPDITRRGGSPMYRKAIEGESGGVDNRGSSMNAFLGANLLTDLLIMGKYGVFIDAPVLKGNSKADAATFKPYVYGYPVESILQLTPAEPGSPSDFSSVLLRDCYTEAERRTGKNRIVQRYRYLWLGDDGKVKLQFIDEDGKEQGPTHELGLTQIPFVMFDIGCSLMKDISRYQIALLNMESMDTLYAIVANYPFLTKQEQKIAQHLEGSGEDVSAGVHKGMSYPKDYERPGFISPPTEPLKASIEARKELKREINELVNIAVENLNSEDPGLDSGLAFIGAMVKMGECRISEHWAGYESTDPTTREVAVIAYPEQWRLRPATERIEEAKALTELIQQVPSREGQKCLREASFQALMGGRITVERMDKVLKEIQAADYTTGDPETVFRAKELGAVDTETACKQLGYADGVAAKAKAEFEDRLAAQQAAQAGPGARGGESADPKADAELEKKQAANKDDKPTLEDAGRGPAPFTKE